MSSSSPRQPKDLKFLLDANLSYRVSDALKMVELPFLHVSQVPGFEEDVVGRSAAPDEQIAKWCEAAGRILVTVDDDFKGRTARTQLLTTLGLEVVVFDWQPVGLSEQHRVVTRYYHQWLVDLIEESAGPRVWVQGKRGRAAVQSTTSLVGPSIVVVYLVGAFAR